MVLALPMRSFFRPSLFWLLLSLGTSHGVSAENLAATPSGSRRLLVHREGPKHTNPNGMCSTVIDAHPAVSLTELKEIVSTRLGFPAGRFALSTGEDVDSL